MAYGKKSVKDHFNAAGKKAKSFLRKLFWASAMVGVIGGAGYYEYGTVHTQDVQTTGFASTIKLNSAGFPEADGGAYIFYTNHGTFIAEPSRFHFQSQEDADAIFRQADRGKTYRITTYGAHLIGNWQPNILELKEVTPEQLAAEAQQKEMLAKKTAEAHQKKPAAVVQPVVASQQADLPVGTVQPQAGLSGEVVTYPVVINGYSVQLTVPVEAVGKVVINNVKPVAPRPPSP